jgi:hypothetical protein
MPELAPKPAPESIWRLVTRLLGLGLIGYAGSACITARHANQWRMNDRLLLLADPKRPQDHDVPGEPNTIRAYAVREPYTNRPSVTEEGKKILFGQTATNLPRR